MQTHIFYSVSESADSPWWIWKIFLCEKGQGAWSALRWPWWHRTESCDCLQTPLTSFLLLRLVFERIKPGDEGQGNGNNPQITWTKQLLPCCADLSYKLIFLDLTDEHPPKVWPPLWHTQTLQGPGSGCVFHVAVMREDGKTWDPTGPTEALLRSSLIPLESAEHHSWWSKSLHQKYLSQSLSVTSLTRHWFTGLQLMASSSGISYATANIWKIGSSPLHQSMTDQEEPSSSPGVQPYVGTGSWALSWTEPGQGQPQEFSHHQCWK